MYAIGDALGDLVGACLIAFGDHFGTRLGHGFGDMLLTGRSFIVLLVFCVLGTSFTFLARSFVGPGSP